MEYQFQHQLSTLGHISEYDCSISQYNSTIEEQQYS